MTDAVNISRIQELGGWLPGGGGELSYKSVGDAHQKIQIKPVRETNVGVAQA